MTRKPLRTILAAIVAASLGLGAATMPAAAGGSLSISVAPGNGEQDRTMRTALGLYSLFNNARDGASVRQNGRDNSAGLRQDGRRNQGVIHQEGEGHNGTLHQSGRDNAYGLFQFGRDTDANVVQRGRGSTGATFQFGW